MDCKVGVCSHLGDYWQVFLNIDVIIGDQYDISIIHRYRLMCAVYAQRVRLAYHMTPTHDSHTPGAPTGETFINQIAF